MIYLDHNATTPLLPEVVEAMERVLRDVFGNPSSAHVEGSRARAELDLARERVAALAGFAADEIVFTSSATEANNMVLASVLREGGALVTSTVEHPSVSEPASELERVGVKVTRVPVDGLGRLEPAEMAAALGAETRLVSLIWANNETGVLQPVEAVAAEAARGGIPLHSDATQALGKVPVTEGSAPIAFLSGSAHKFNGPKGVGFLAVRRGRSLPPLLRGGPQERRLRGGTENLAGIVGMGIAAQRAREELEARAARHGALRDRLWEGIRRRIPDVRCNAPSDAVLPNTLSIEFRGAAGDVLVEALDLEGVCVSAGAACASGSVEPSRVLLALGRSPEEARATVRFSVGVGVDEAQVDRVLALLPALVARVRGATA